MKLRDHEALGELYSEQVLVNEGPLRSAAIGAAALASGFLGGNAKADDSATVAKSPMIQHAQAATQTAGKSVLNNVQGLKSLAAAIKQDQYVVNKAPFIKLLTQMYGIQDDNDLYDAIKKDIDTYNKKIEDSELSCPEEEAVMDYLNHHSRHLQNYITTVLKPELSRYDNRPLR
jgi:hypothetical protein